MMKTEFMNTSERTDAELVAECLAGGRDAFRAIVERYQILICSLAYNRTGSVSQSEDIAQETFLAAWMDLRSLREPEKLRSWLCAIVRNRIKKCLRRKETDPVLDAALLDAVHDSPNCEALPSEQAIMREEEALLWRSLERIPQLYREPLILFYRQNQSVEQVAIALELSEDAVKQRLARGRKLLQEEVQAFVENTLSRTIPSQAFSGAVLSSLPVASGASFGAGVATKVLAAAKTGLLGALLPFAGFFAAFAGQWVVIDATSAGRERKSKLLRLTITWICLLGIPVIGEVTIQWLGQHLAWSDAARFSSRIFFWGLWAMALAAGLIATCRREMLLRRRNEEEQKSPGPRCKPISRTKSAFIQVSGQLGMSWLIVVAWRAHDHAGAIFCAAVLLLLAVWNFFHLRGKTGVAAGKIACGHLAICCAVVIAFIDVRLSVWMASGYGISVAEVHRMFPFWMVTLMNAALLIWIAIMLAVTAPKPPAATQSNLA